MKLNNIVNHQPKNIYIISYNLLVYVLNLLIVFGGKNKRKSKIN